MAWVYSHMMNGALAMLGEVFPDSDDGRVHLAFHVAGVVVAAVMENALVVNQARVVQPVEKPAHFIDDVAAEGLVAAAPDEDAGVVFVALEHGIDAVEHHRRPFHAVAGQGVVDVPLAALDGFPCAVRFHVGFVDDVQAQFVAQGIQRAGVG